LLESNHSAPASFHDVSALFDGSASLFLLRRARRTILTECVHASPSVGTVNCVHTAILFDHAHSAQRVRLGRLHQVLGKRGIFNDAGRVKSFFKCFLFSLTEFEHTSSSTHQRHLFLLLLFIGVTLTCSARLHSSTQCCPPNISSITIDHDELFELPLPPGRRVA
jgi:hypothetical protein